MLPSKRTQICHVGYCCDPVQKKSRNTNANLDLVRFLEQIPHEVLLMLIDTTAKKDIVHLSTVCKRVRRVLKPYVFCCVRCSWEQLQNIEKCPLSLDSSNLIESLRLLTSCSKSEWTYPFHQLFAESTSNRFSNLCSLQLHSSGSTSFFKYCDVGPNLKRLAINTTKENSLFSLPHIRSFRNVEYLELSNFQIDEFEEDQNLCPRLKTLKLVNCSWNYPFMIENFGRNKIVTLSLHYSNSFIISERFRVFLSKPDFRNLESLELTNCERNLKLTISLEIMKLIKAIPTLKILKLKGNIYNETLNNFSKADVDNCMNYLALDNVKVFYSSFFIKEQET